MQNRKRDTDVQNSLLDSVGEGEDGMFQENSIETCILSRVKQITSPGWMHETSARTWCTGKTQRDRVEREVGGGIGMGNTYKLMAVSFQCMKKSTTIKKKKRKQIFKPIPTKQYTQQHCSQQSKGINNPNVYRKYNIFISIYRNYPGQKSIGAENQ